MIDSHAHLTDTRHIANLATLCEGIGAERMSIAGIVTREDITDNPALYAAKGEYPDRFYVFTGLDHSSHFSNGTIKTPSLAQQVDRALALGADGIKLLETKPDRRKWVDIPVDGDYYEDMFARIEDLGAPILWHVADPEEFWDPETTPGWAKSAGWGYDETFAAKEQLYAEVENVLKRHPRLRVIFAHFYFLSADLPRAAALFERHEGVHFDLAPGIEMLYNSSRNVPRAREFFMQYAERIIFGTDIEGAQTLEQARLRAGIITRWLETDDEFRVPQGADYVLGPPEDGVIRGLSLPAEALARIYSANFEHLAGTKPKRIDRKLAAQECERIAKEVALMGGNNTLAEDAARRLRG